MILIKIVLFIFIAGFVAALWLGVSFLRRVKSVQKEMKRQMGNPDSMSGGARTYGNQEGVVDHRNPEKAKQKIFKDDEGEYVDFTEE